MNKQTFVVSLTGAAGNIGSSLIYQLLQPKVFSSEPYKVVLKLVDLKEKHDLLAGRVMEIEDSFFETYERAEIHDDCEDAFRDADCIILAGARPRTVGMERQDLLKINAKIIQKQARYINEVAKPSTKVLVVGNPSNTNALLFADAAPSIPKANITSLSMLDFNRAVTLVAKQAHVHPRSVQGIRVFGNHSRTMYIDASRAYADVEDTGAVIRKKITDLVAKEFLENDLQKIVQDRGIQIIESIGHSSSFSSAYAIVKHLKCWFIGTDDLVAVGVIVNDLMGCGTELCVTLPVRAQNGRFVTEEKPLESLTDEYVEKIKASINELVLEKNMAFALIKSNS